VGRFDSARASRRLAGDSSSLRRRIVSHRETLGRRHVGHESVRSSESAARDVPSHATGHYRIKYRQAAFSATL